MGPVIGISSYHREGEMPSFTLPCSYIDAVREAGGIPLILPPGEARPADLLAIVDGLILAGGGDLDPSLYGGTLHSTQYMISPERDAFEDELARVGLTDPELPLLCICRGLQVLNVALGGTLVSHLPDRYGEQVAHRLPPRLPTRHRVKVEPQSRLAKVLGQTEVDACSWHHQAVDHLGADLQASAWSDDGVIEAIEHTRHPWCFGIQWHPEMQFDEVVQMRLFRAFSERAARAKEIKRGKGS